MTNIGTVYGVVLNDRAEQADYASAFTEAPYAAPPKAPVVYIKPAACISSGGAPVKLPAGETSLKLSPTIALLFGRASVDGGVAAVAAAALALDVSLPGGDYYRPDIARRCRDGFLPLAAFGAADLPDELITYVDDAPVHRWSLSRLLRDPATLIADLSAFMTLRAGDVLLIGLPGDAPIGHAGQSVRVEAEGMATLSTRIMGETR